MSRRSRVREVVLQVLFEEDMNPTHSMVASDKFVRQRLDHDQELIDFAMSLVSGVRRNRPELDQMLADRAANWSLKRMAVTDRNVLRLGAYEMLFTDTPPRVVINEAIDLARRFGTEQSAQFVNGVLDRFVDEAPGRDAPGDADIGTQ